MTGFGEDSEPSAAIVAWASALSPELLRPQLLAQPLVDDLWVRLALGLAHHLADEEAEQALFAAAIGLHLRLVLAEDPVDHGIELGSVGPAPLAQVLLRRAPVPPPRPAPRL